MSYLRTSVGRILAAGRIRTVEQAFAVSVQSYNETPQALLANYSPNEITWDNVEKVVEHEIQHREDIWASIVIHFLCTK